MYRKRRGGTVIVGVEADPKLQNFKPNPYPNVSQEWVSTRIHDLTSPSVECSVHDLSELMNQLGFNGACVYGISVPKKRYVGQHFTVNGVSKIRRGKECKPFLIAAEDDRTNALVEGLTVEDLSVTAIDWALARHRSKFPGSPDYTHAEFLSNARVTDLYLPDEDTEPAYKLRLAALVLFGKQAAIKRHMPHFETVVSTPSGSRRIQANLIETMRELVFNTSAVLPTYFRSVPLNALHELVVNAFVHRCWRTPAPVNVTIEENLLTIANPGELLPGLSPTSLLYGIPQYRNFLLADAGRFSALCDKVGGGINIAVESVVDGGFTFPEFASDDNTFTVRLSLSQSAEFAEFIRHRSSTLSSMDEVLTLRVVWERDQSVTSKQIQNILQRDARTTARVLSEMVKKNILEDAGADQFQMNAAVRQDIQDIFQANQYKLF